jgi:hypothetical protein
MAAENFKRCSIAVRIRNENDYQNATARRREADDPSGERAPQYLIEMPFLPLAHVGHWAMWVLYLVPVVIVLAATVKAFLDQRRDERGGGERSG